MAGSSLVGKKLICADCHSCQICSNARCNLCRGETGKSGVCGLSPGFTYEEYLLWKGEKDVREQKPCD